MMHIYAFGSLCRGDVQPDSDIDLLAIVDGRDARLSQDKFSIYSYQRLRELWVEGNAFAWHLSLESRLLFAKDNVDFLRMLGRPATYSRGAIDCARFRAVYESAFSAIEAGSPSLVFELSTAFVAVRNIATCFSLSVCSVPTFGRDSARRLGLDSLQMSEDVYDLLMRCRVLSTRGVGSSPGDIDRSKLLAELRACRTWMDGLIEKVAING